MMTLPKLSIQAKRHPFALRYTVTHDIFHILLGFDTSYAGEAGVFGFTVGQHYTKALNWVYPLVKLIFLIIKPWQAKDILASARRGKELGEQADCLLAYSFEDNWARVRLLLSKDLQRDLVCLE